MRKEVGAQRCSLRGNSGSRCYATEIHLYCLPICSQHLVNHTKRSYGELERWKNIWEQNVYALLLARLRYHGCVVDNVPYVNGFEHRTFDNSITR